MFRSTRALAVLAALLLAGACAQSPTAPTSTSAGAVVGDARQTPASIPDAIVPSPQALGATRYMAFGDSITCGVVSTGPAFSLLPLNCLPTDYGYPERLLGMLDAYNPAQVFSVRKRGEAGEWAQDGVSRLTSELAELAGPSVAVNARPQALLLLEGINDMNGGGLSPTRAAGSVAQMVQIARVYNMTVLVATMYQTYRNETLGHDNARDKIVPFNDELRRLVGGLQNVRIVDLYASFGTNAFGTWVGPDGLHPTPAGYDRMAQKFHGEIQLQFPVRGGLQ